MFRSVLSLALVGVLSLFSLAGTVQAEPPMVATPAPPSLPMEPPPPFPMPQALQILTDQSVPQMLQQAGYQVQTLQAGDGQSYWKITSPQLSQGIDVVPIRTPGKIDGLILRVELPVQANTISQQGLLNLMAANEQNAPFFFTYSPQTGKLYLAHKHVFPDSNSQELQGEISGLNMKLTQVLPQVNALVQQKIDNGKVLDNLANTSWSGQEKITGQWTPISFKFQAGGQATMVIPGGTYSGTWNQTGNQVTISLPTINNTFTGTINGNTISGQGKDNVGPWDFTLNKLN
jgi:hypothetical protein